MATYKEICIWTQILLDKKLQVSKPTRKCASQNRVGSKNYHTIHVFSRPFHSGLLCFCLVSHCLTFLTATIICWLPVTQFYELLSSFSHNKLVLSQSDRNNKLQYGIRNYKHFTSWHQCSVQFYDLTKTIKMGFLSHSSTGSIHKNKIC